MRYLITEQSRNAKTGPIFVSTSPRETCPDVCPLKDKGGCYAESGPLKYIWDGLDRTPEGESFKNGRSRVDVKSHGEILQALGRLKHGSLARLNQAGDLPGIGNNIDEHALEQLTLASGGKKVFTYTHKPTLGETKPAVKNRSAIAKANQDGTRRQVGRSKHCAGRFCRSIRSDNKHQNPKRQKGRCVPGHDA
jgi:hypothetical protein